MQRVSTLLAGARQSIGMHWKTALLIGVALLVEIIAFFWLRDVAHAHGEEMVYLTGDSGAYKIYAENLLKYHMLTFSSAPPLYPDTVRTPGYPLFTAALFAISRSWDAVILLQGLMVSVAPYLVYRIGSFVHEKAAWIAAWMFLFLPNRLYWSNTLMSDAPMMVLFFVALLTFLQWRESRRMSRLVLAGVCIGAATIFRPVTMLVWTVFLLAIVLTHGMRHWRTWGRDVVIFFCSFLLLVAPWSVRNYRLFGNWQLSAVGNYSFAYANAILYAHEQTGESLPSLRAHFDEAIQGQQDPLRSVSLERMDAYNRFTSQIIGNDIFGYAKWHAVKSIPFFLSDGLRQPAEAFGITATGAPINFSDLFLHGGFIRGLVAFLREQPVTGALFLIGTGFWAFITALTFASAFLIVKDRTRRQVVVLFIFLTLYFFAVSSGPVAQARYRLPVEGLMFVLAGYVACLVWEWGKRRVLPVDNEAADQCNMPASP